MRYGKSIYRTSRGKKNIGERGTNPGMAVATGKRKPLYARRGQRIMCLQTRSTVSKEGREKRRSTQERKDNTTRIGV